MSALFLSFLLPVRAFLPLAFCKKSISTGVGGLQLTAYDITTQFLIFRVLSNMFTLLTLEIENAYTITFAPEIQHISSPEP